MGMEQDESSTDSLSGCPGGAKPGYDVGRQQFTVEGADAAAHQSFIRQRINWILLRGFVCRVDRAQSRTYDRNGC